MGKNKEKGSKKSDRAALSEPSDVLPSNGKQNDRARSSERKEKDTKMQNKKSDRAERSTRSKNNQEVTDNTTSARFIEDDEVVDVEVMERNSELLGTDSQGEDEDEDDDEPPALLENNRNSEDEEGLVNENESMASSNVVSFNNNAGNIREKKKRILEYSDSEDEITDPAEVKSMLKFAKFLEKTGYLRKPKTSQDEEQVEDKPKKGQQDNTKAKKKRKKNESEGNIYDKAVCQSNSESTIYRNAVAFNIEQDKTNLGENLIPLQVMDCSQLSDNQVIGKTGDGVMHRFSSSSDEPIDTSDELINTSPPCNIQQAQQAHLSVHAGDNDYVLFKRFLDFQLREQREMVRRNENDRRSGGYEQQPQASTSRQIDTVTPQEQAKQLLQQAEASKARMYQVPGKDEEILSPFDNQRVVSNSDILLSMLVDEKYDVVENHVDEVTRKKIINGEYVDLARLIPKDRVQTQQDNCMVQINKNGLSYYVPAHERESVTINSYPRWEQAFRVFSTIYVQTYPNKAKELMQYNHTIYTASLKYTWDNVYAYDIDFRMHLSKNPGRSWGVILNLAWNMRLVDKVRSDSSASYNSPANPRSGKKVCWRYNRGKCTYGFGCKFDHKCGVCGKHGHGAHICRKAKNNGNSNFSNAGISGGNNGPKYIDHETGELAKEKEVIKKGGNGNFDKKF